MIDELSIPDEPEEATKLLDDHYDLDRDCSRCDVSLELGLVLGNSLFAVGVLVCPNCGYEGHDLIADPNGKASDDEYKQLIDGAMQWVPPWHPGSADVTADWRCACGKTWKSSELANKHVEAEHPSKSRLSMVRHDRYPWKNVDNDETANP